MYEPMSVNEILELVRHGNWTGEKWEEWIRYRRLIPQKETYECLADYPLLMGGEG